MIEVISRRTPFLANVKPSGQYLMEDFFYAGGLPALMKEILPLLHGDALTISGKTVAENTSTPFAVAAGAETTVAPPLAVTTPALWSPETPTLYRLVSEVRLAGATAALRSPIGPIMADPELRGFFLALMHEAFAVGKAKSVALDSGFVDECMSFVTNKVEPSRKASMAYDLEHGKRLELDWLTGKVRALGRALGIPTPASDAAYTVLKLHRQGN